MGEMQPDTIERVARALCRYTWEREFKGRNLDAYVEIHWKDHAAAARIAIAAQQDGVIEELAKCIKTHVSEETYRRFLSFRAAEVVHNGALEQRSGQ
ncbi:MAG: hypothetical protein IJ935_07400 [Afipia sp.]|nr:hypothetical protein [Afipia sp.]